MAENKDWYKVDLRDAQILSLTTIMDNMKSKSSGTVLVTKADAYKEKNTNNEFINGLECWRTVNTDKTKVVKGRTYYWCPHHVKRECGTECMLLTSLRTIKEKGQMAPPPFN